MSPRRQSPEGRDLTSAEDLLGGRKDSHAHPPPFPAKTWCGAGLGDIDPFVPGPA